MAHGDQQEGSQIGPLVAGVIAGAANVTSGYAFDTVKVRLQTAKYNGMLHCFRHIVQTEGIRGLYQGLTPPLLGGAAETGVNYLVYSRLLRSLSARLADLQPQGHQQQHQQQRQPPLLAVPIAGAGAGVALSLILGPTELLKCRLQTTGRQAGPMTCIRQVLAEEGYAGLTRGLGATFIREVPGNAIFFTTYEWLRRTKWLGNGNSSNNSSSSSNGSSKDDSDSSNGTLGTKGEVGLASGTVQQLLATARSAGSAIVCGGLAGVVMWGTVLPLDVAKSRIQVARPGGPWDVGVAAHLRMLWAEGGLRALWSGLTPTLVRAFPANAAQWLAYELVLQQFEAGKR